MAVLIKVALPNEAPPPDIGGTEGGTHAGVNGTPLREWEENSAVTLTTKKDADFSNLSIENGNDLSFLSATYLSEF